MSITSAPHTQMLSNGPPQDHTRPESDVQHRKETAERHLPTAAGTRRRRPTHLICREGVAPDPRARSIPPRAMSIGRDKAESSRTEKKESARGQDGTLSRHSRKLSATFPAEKSSPGSWHRTAPRTYSRAAPRHSGSARVPSMEYSSPTPRPSTSARYPAQAIHPLRPPFWSTGPNGCRRNPFARDENASFHSAKRPPRRPTAP